MSRPPVAQQRAAAWIKRRARRLVRPFEVSRREAVASARQDWTHLYPTPQGAVRRIEQA